MSKITNKAHVNDVCKMGQKKDCCSYLAFGYDGWQCMKESSLKTTIDARRSAGVMNAMGDNCIGYDVFVKKNSVM